MRRERNADVLVVGAGPVGSSVACRLAERGLDVGIVDDRYDRGEARGGSVLLYRDTLERLERLSIRAADLGPTMRIERLAFFRGEEPRSSLTLPNGDARVPLVATLAGIERALARRLAEEKVGVAYRRRICEVRTEPRGVDLRVGEISREAGGYAIMQMEEVVGHLHTESAAWVVAADGSDSIVRARLDLPLEPAAESALHAVLELASAFPGEPGEMRIVLDGEVSATAWALPSGGHRWTFRIPDSMDLREELRAIRPEPTVRHLMAALARRFPWFDADPDRLVYAEVERYAPSLARRVGEGRVWLVGDAAHRVDPLASRALNEGLLEGERLAEQIAGALDGTLPHARLGSDYERDVRETLAPVFDPESCFEPTGAKDPFLAESYRRIVPLLPAEGPDLDRLSAELGLTRRRAA